MSRDSSWTSWLGRAQRVSSAQLLESAPLPGKSPGKVNGPQVSPPIPGTAGSRAGDSSLPNPSPFLLDPNLNLRETSSKSTGIPPAGAVALPTLRSQHTKHRQGRCLWP